ncbi:plasmid partitioning protein RepA [Methylobacterium sp. 092160098-2]|uniref:plasmid partitioning protein RepA n=1 Tax=Methylobacterium sp. 092160098-2 TaxID=3025129 RepID=UPI002381A4A3|nr:plasmid partitioning protein RepA [Methylobacterium sp. 092160098-2]MDE4915090.1 plasmid partitioning protein RepA [Methylobacterium sp. 092160098-2]
MNQHVPYGGPLVPASNQTAGDDAKILGSKLREIAAVVFSPAEAKTLRRFTSGEVARILGVTDSRIRQLSPELLVSEAEVAPGGRRMYTLADIHALRAHLDAIDRVGKRYLPHRDPAKGEHLQVIACVNFKGGSGKTTTSAHLAQSLVLRGYRVLAIDLDPQASLSTLLGVRPENEREPYPTIYDAIQYGAERRPLSDVIMQTYFTGLDLVAANLELEVFEFEAPMQSARRRPGDVEPPFFARMAMALGEVGERYDVVVIDCPPRLGYLTIAALCAATSLLITIHPQMLDVSSMHQFLKMMDELMAPVREQGAAPTHDWFRYLVTRFEPQDTPQTEIVAMLRGLFGDRVLTKAMLQSVAISNSGLRGQTVYETPLRRDEVTGSTYRRALDALDAVNGEIEKLIARAWGRS